MVKSFYLVRRAIVLWWREFILLIFFNLAWLVLQIPIVTGPAATAAMYAIAQRLVSDEFIEPYHGWMALRRMFLPALKWGAVNFIIVMAVVANFWAYQNFVGIGWTILRLVWGTIALGWFAVNLFYWPFWLAQEDRSMRTTMRNGFLFLTKRPSLALPLTFISAALIVVSILTTLPLATILMTWLALIGVLAVEEEIKPNAQQ